VVDSTGSFTLDPKKAEEKLRNFSFASPDHYLLKVVQCAVAGGAETVEIKTGATRISIQFGGEAMSCETVSGMVGYLLSAEIPLKDRRFRHLAAGLRGAAGCSPDGIIFDFWTGDSNFQRVWDEQGWRQTAVQKTSGFHQFILVRTWGQTMTSASQEVLGVLSSRDTTEEALLRKHCLYAPCKLTLDGETLPESGFGKARYPGYDIFSDPNPGESRPPRYLEAGTLIDGFMVGEHHLVEKFIPGSAERPGCLPLPDSQATLRDDSAGPGLQGGWLALTAVLGTPRIVYVEDGVVIEEEEADDIPIPGLFAVLSAVGLQKDLTGFQLVRDQAFHDLRVLAIEEAVAMKRRVLENLPLFPNRERIQEALN